MECNKDEAIRAKEIAEKKYTAKDIAGAKKFTLKAQNLYPGIEGLPQMLATFDVYISAENKICGEADWYGILGVSPSADDDTVKRQYRKLALMIHPDKNKSVGADGAFKLISEAWSLLSDKTKRIAYDQKRNVIGFQQKVPPPSGGTSAPLGMNGFCNSSHTTTSNSKTQKSADPHPPLAPASSRPSKLNMFWTECNHCKMKCKFLRIYINHNLLCPNCHEPFHVVETSPPPSNGSNTAPWTFSHRCQNSNHHATNSNAYTPGRNTAVPAPAPAPAPAPNMRATAPASAAAGQAATVDHQAYKRVRRECEEVQETARREDALQRKNHAPKKMAGGLSTGFSNSGSSHAVKGERPVKKPPTTVVQQAYKKVRREPEEVQSAVRREDALQRNNHVPKKMAGGLSTGFSNSGSSHVVKGERPVEKQRGPPTTVVQQAREKVRRVCEEVQAAARR